jgi:hypothetical protein
MAAVHQQRLRNWKLIGVVVTSLSTFVAAGVAGVKLIWPDSSPTNVCAQDGSVAAGRDISGTVITTRREPQQNLDQMDDRRTMECGNTVKTKK